MNSIGKFSTSTCTRLEGGNYETFNTIKDTNRISKKNKRALYWFVPNNLYFIYYFSGYVTPILTYFMCVMDMVMKNSLDLYLCYRRI